MWSTRSELTAVARRVRRLRGDVPNQRTVPLAGGGLLAAGLPYRLVGAQRFYGRREVKDVIAYLRLVHNPDDQVSLLRVLNTPSRGLGSRSTAALLEAAGGTSPGRLLIQLGAGEAALPAGLSGKAASALLDFGAACNAAGPEQEQLGFGIDRGDSEGHQLSQLPGDGTEEGRTVGECPRIVQPCRGVRRFRLATFLESVALVSDRIP